MQDEVRDCSCCNNCNQGGLFGNLFGGCNNDSTILFFIIIFLNLWMIIILLRVMVMFMNRVLMLEMILAMMKLLLNLKRNGDDICYGR